MRGQILPAELYDKQTEIPGQMVTGWQGKQNVR